VSYFSPVFLALVFFLSPFSADRKSAVTWATGFLSPAPDGQKAFFTDDPMFAPMTWDAARKLYFDALTNRVKNTRQKSMSDTFSAVGHVMHLLQDMAVPAHTRNDFQSHLIGKTLAETTSLNPIKWKKQPYEYYVQVNADIVRVATPVFPVYDDLKITDFWDTNNYNGNNPSITGKSLSNIGLAEFSNSSYFSDYTIYPNNNPTLAHTYPYPYINDSTYQGGYQICADLSPVGSSYPEGYPTRKYISRKIKGVCPPVSAARSADHFAVVSLLDEDNTSTIPISSLRLWLDNNVHNTYANELLPAAIGYSAGLLNYFFRGDIRLEYTAEPNA